MATATALVFNSYCHECNVDIPLMYFKIMFNIEDIVHNTSQATEYKKNPSFFPSQLFPALEAKTSSALQKPFFNKAREQEF